MNQRFCENCRFAHLDFAIARPADRSALGKIESTDSLVAVVVSAVFHVEVQRIVIRDGPLASRIDVAVHVRHYDRRSELLYLAIRK